jgi:zinc/manganese transport system substrate-binding protein
MPPGFDLSGVLMASIAAGLIDQIKNTHLQAVFLENSNDSRLVEQIASETGVQLDSTLYAKALSTADGPAPSYVSMFRYNIETLLHGMNFH